jgi:uncharacterized protein (TIGR03067 family)
MGFAHLNFVEGTAVKMPWIRSAANVGLIALLATRLMGGEPPKQDAVRKDRDGIQGTWKIVALEADGKQAPAEIVAALKLVFKGDSLTFTPGEPGFSNYNYKLDPTTTPARFDMTHADGPKQGESDKGIYSLEGNHLRICFGKANTRPKGFTTTAGSGVGMYTLEREKP